MIGWIVVAAYAPTWMIAARKAVVLLQNELDHSGISPLDAEDRVMCRVFGMFLGLIWPLLLIGMAVGWRLPKTDRELRAEVDARNARIAELEREAGIR